MKFILNENNAKLILDERFILNEADTDLVSKIKERLKIYTPELKNDLLSIAGQPSDNSSLETYKEEIAPIAETEKKAKDAIENDDFGKVKGPINAYTNLIREIINRHSEKNGNGNPLNGTPNLKRNLDQLDALADELFSGDKSAADKGRILTELSVLFDKTSAAINEAVEKNTPADKEESRQNLRSAINDAWAQIDKTTNAVEQLTDTDNDRQKTLNSLLNSLVEVNPSDSIENILNNLTTIKNGCTAFLSANNAEKEFSNRAAPGRTAKQDWRKLLDQAANNKDEAIKIWDAYYKTEWGKDAQKVKDLGSTFTQELLHLGFSVASNPFIYFIRYALRTGLDININNYAAIHNAYVHEFIDDEDLTRQSPTASSDKNVLYCPDLYKDSPTNILTKLSIQKDIIDNYAKRKDVLAADLYENDDDMPTLIVAILSDEVEIKNLAKQAPKQNFAAAKLRNIENTNIAYMACFGQQTSGVSTKNAANAGKELQSIAKAIQNLVLEKKAPTYVATKYDTGDGALIKIAKDNNNGLLADLSEQNIKDLGNIFKKYSTFTSANLTDLIKLLNGENVAKK